MHSNPEQMNDAKVRGIVLLILTLLLVVIIVLLVRAVQTPRVTQATTKPVSVGPITPPPEGYQSIGAAIEAAKPTATPEPTPEPTNTPEPTARPSPTPRPTEIKALRRGDKSEEVRAMQQRLIELGYLKQGDADGGYGKGTKAAVQEFQKNNGLAPDGVAGRETISKMFSPEAR